MLTTVIVVVVRIGLSRWGGHTLAMTLATSSVLGAPASIMGSELSVYLAPILFLALIHERPRRSVTGSSSVQFYEVELGC